MLKFFWQALVGAMTGVFKNYSRDQFGTLIPFTGEAPSGPAVDILATIGNILRKSESAGRTAVDHSLLAEGAEQDLYSTVQNMVPLVSSHVRRGTEAPCRSCRNKPSTTMPASCCGGIDRAS